MYTSYAPPSAVPTLKGVLLLVSDFSSKTGMSKLKLVKNKSDS